MGIRIIKIEGVGISIITFVGMRKRNKGIVGSSIRNITRIRNIIVEVNIKNSK